MLLPKPAYGISLFDNGMNEREKISGGMGAAQPHESARMHVTGDAQYTDDIPVPEGTLHAAVGMSEKAHARITLLDLTKVSAADGVVAVLTAVDIPGENNHGPVAHDDPIFAEQVVEYVGQSVFAVVATSVNAARKAARLATIEYEDLEPVLSIRDALDKESFVLPSRTLARGHAAEKIERAPHRLTGSLAMGGQDHFYLEGQIALAVPGEDGTMLVYSSTQHPTEIQHLVATVLNERAKDVFAECRRMGGGFGGKETQAALIACIAAVAARKTGVAVKLRLDRDDDMLLTGKRHPFEAVYDVGFDKDGGILGLKMTLSSDCGRSVDLSEAVNLRAIFHVDNCYYLPDVEIVCHRCKTNSPSNTAFRGFGGPQGMMAIEYVIDDIARFLNADALAIRRRNFYGENERNVTPYGMVIEDNIIDKLVGELEARCSYSSRQAAIEKFNRESPVLRKGIALTPVKFGISFMSTHLNQAGALIHVYNDGTVLLNHGGTEMGQGLHTKVSQVVAEELQVDISQIRCTATNTSKVPNTSATAASSGSDLNGRAAQAAARTIKERLIVFAAAKYEVAPEQIKFLPGRIAIGSKLTVSFADLVRDAYMARVSLSATGFYRTPKITYDAKTLRGRPFYYFAYGAAASEVIIDTLTGEFRLSRVDILHDVGRSINPAIDMGQVEGGFMQGVGWLTSEELWSDDTGRPMVHSPSTYKIPTAHDWPDQFNVDLLAWGCNKEENLYRSKAVGEPPLMLSLSVFSAIRNAIAGSGEGQTPSLDVPATPERILRAVAEVQSQSSRPQDARVAR